MESLIYIKLINFFMKTELKMRWYYCNFAELGCLQTILSDQSRALEENCKEKLLQRVEMFKNAAPLVAAPENLSDLYTQVSSSPAKKFFFIAFLTFVGFIFIFGLFCGRATRRTIAMKNKWNGRVRWGISCEFWGICDFFLKGLFFYMTKIYP